MAADRTFRWLLLGLATLAVIADQASKYTVFHWLDRPDQVHFNTRLGEYELIPPRLLVLEARHFEELEPAGGWFTPLRTLSSPRVAFVNRGALFGMKLGLSPAQANLAFSVVSLLAALGIIYWSTRPAAARDRLLCLSLGLILGGTLGNLYDRVVFDGVRDFLHFQIVGSDPNRPFFDWPVFNLADCCLVCGAVLLAWQAFWTKPESAPAPAPAP